MTYIIGRVYNNYGVSDWFSGKDASGAMCFTGLLSAQHFKSEAQAHRMARVLKKKVPVLMGGFPITYEVEEVGMIIKFIWKRREHGMYLYTNGICLGHVMYDVFKPKGAVAGKDYVWVSRLPKVERVKFDAESDAMRHGESATREWFRDCLG